MERNGNIEHVRVVTMMKSFSARKKKSEERYNEVAVKIEAQWRWCRGAYQGREEDVAVS